MSPQTFGLKKLTRREMLRLSAITAAGAFAVACTPAVAPSGGADEGAAPTVEKISIIATSQMPIDTWDNAMERVGEALPNIDLEVTNTQIGASDGMAILI